MKNTRKWGTGIGTGNPRAPQTCKSAPYREWREVRTNWIHCLFQKTFEDSPFCKILKVKGFCILRLLGRATFLTHSVGFLYLKSLIWLDVQTFYAHNHRSVFITSSVKLNAGFVVHCCVMKHISHIQVG